MSATTVVPKPVQAAPKPVQAAPQPVQTGAKLWGLLLAVAVLLLVLVLPTPEGLPIAGQRVLAVFGFAVVVWVTEALDYAVSAVVIAALLAFLLGMSPDPAKPTGAAGHRAGPDHRRQRLRQHGADAGGRGAVPGDRDDHHRPRPPHRAGHPVAGRRRAPAAW